MFSATMPRAIEMLAQKYQRNAQRINTASAQKQHIDIEYRALVTASHESENAIFNVLRYYDAINAIVFCGTRAAVTRLESRFANRGFSVVALSGELSQSARTHALQAMRDHRAQVCIATDVAARGIDLPDLELVIHADLPKNTEALLHRSGRTGRAGRKGTSVLIVPHSARRRTERLLREAQITAKWGDPPSVEEIKKRDDERLLGDELLSEPLQGAETGIVRALVARHGPEQIAAAFVRLYRKGQAAPEDLAPAPAWSEGQERSDRRPPRGEAGGNFVSGGAWISLSVGRNQRAEPRWLIPMLCKAGGINKRELGAIRIQQNETHVEISATSIDGFFERIGRAGNIEKGISATRIDAPPQIETPYTERPKRTERPERTERPQRAERPERVEHPPRSDRPKHAEQPRRNPKPHRKGAEERRPPSKKPAPKGKHRK
jgi:ATP-dependent RNA helicase DeaD